MRGLAFALALLPPLALLTCAPDAGDAPDAGAPDGTPVRVEATPLLSVGVRSGDPVRELHRVVTPFLLPDGRLVVPLAGDREIRVFGPDGAYVGRLGGPGEGPGEFAALSAAWARGDTVEAFDSRLRRITRFLPDGTHQTVPLERVASAEVALPGTLDEGWAVVGIASAGFGGRDEMVVHAFARDGSHREELTRVDGMARFLTEMGGGPDPLSPRARFAVGGDVVFVAETLTPSVRAFRATGEPAGEIHWDPGPPPDPEATFRAVVDSAVARSADADAEMTRLRLEAFPVRDRVSSFWDLIADDEGFLWIRPFEAGSHALALGGAAQAGAGPGGEWLIFDPVGHEVASVAVPDELEPILITGDRMVGIVRDDFGVESVRVHALVRRGPGDG